MNLSLPPGFFGAYLTIFIIMAALFTWWLSPRKIRPTFAFVILHLLSLLFVLLLLMSGSRRGESYFVETGQYYPTSTNIIPPVQGSPSKPTLSMGDARQQPDYVIECVQPPCFDGRIDFSFEQKSNAPNTLSWNAQISSGTLRIRESPKSLFSRTMIWMRDQIPFVKEKESLTGSIELAGQNNQVNLLWESPKSQTPRRALELNLFIELNPESTGSRILVEHDTPRRMELPAAGNPVDSDNDANDSLPSLVYLTSAKQPVALRKQGGSGYVPIIKVGASDPSSNINAFLSRPERPEEKSDDFIVNNGLSRIGYPFGELIYIGSQRGIAATIVTTGGKEQLWSLAAVCLILWLLPLWFFQPISGNLKLFSFIATVQMLLAVRFVLALRAYIWSPHSSEAIETAVFALLFVPLMLGIGCHAVGLQTIGGVREEDSSRAGGPAWRRQLLFKFRPTLYYVLAVLLFPLIWFILREPTNQFISINVLAFQSLEEMWRYWRLVIAVPPLLFFAGIVIDYWLRTGTGEQRDIKYTGSVDDPVTYLITKPDKPIMEAGKWSWSPLLNLLVVLFCGLLVFVLTRVLGSFRGKWWPVIAALILGCIILFWSWLFRRLSLSLRPINRLYAVAAHNFVLLSGIIGVLLIVKALWNLLAFNLLGWTRAASESFFPLFPVRTTTVFEFIILIMMVRLLALFINRWGDAHTAFGWREFFEVVVIFFVPPLLMLVALLASNDTGAMLVHGPALVGATLLVTGLWPLWKAAAGRRWALIVIVLMCLVLFTYYAFASLQATTLMPFADEHSTITHRTLLLGGTESASQGAETGGRTLINAIWQHWRMLNYAAEGGWAGKGYGQSPVSGNRTFNFITLDDLVFSVYVLAEHGALGGWALLALYLLLFLLAARMMWERLRDEPLRLAWAGGLMLMLIFPALYMAAANVNQVIFTGQTLPALGLRSVSDVLRTGLVLMLFAACVRPTTVTAESEATAEEVRTPPWWRLSLQGFSLFRHSRELRQHRLTNLNYNPWTAAAAIATNLAFIVLLLIATAFLPLFGIAQARDDQYYKNDLDLTDLKNRAKKYIEDGHIWFEVVPPGKVAGSECQGGANRNRPAPPTADPVTAYQICMDSNVRGGSRDDTFSQLVQEWNTHRVQGIDKRAHGRGNLLNHRFDDGQFFQLDLARAARLANAKPNDQVSMPLTINANKYQWRSPFHPIRGWIGALTEADSDAGDGGALIGADVVLPLRAAKFGETPVFTGTNPGYTEVTLGASKVYPVARGFAVYAPQAKKPIFKIETVSGAEGALLRPESGDFELYLNGCPVVISETGPCKIEGERGGAHLAPGTAPRLRLDFGDVIAYTKRDAFGKRIPQDVFVYSQAQLGSFSYVAWVDGDYDRFYPQGAYWPMAEQITKAVNSAAEAGESMDKSIALTVNANLNRSVYELIRKWRLCLDAAAPQRSSCADEKMPLRIADSSRQIAVTLMDADTGELLALASDSGDPYDPNDKSLRNSPTAEQQNLNLSRHRIGSAIKPFTAAATLKTFPDLHRLTLLDHRSDRRRVLGLPLGGDKNEITGHGGEITWQMFLPQSDNLYAVTFALLGMSDAEQTTGLPRFTEATGVTAPLQLKLTDNGSSLGLPRWGNIINRQEDQVELLEQTPLAHRLDELFDVRASVPPQAASYDNSMWLPLKNQGLMRESQPFNRVSPEITNFAFDDIDNYSDLRSVLLGGEFNDLAQYGRVGSAWSNVSLAQSFTRITSGRKVTARILAGQNTGANQSERVSEEWFPGASTATWRRELLRGLEGVIVEPKGTAYKALNARVREIAGNRPQYVLGSGQTHFTVLSKSGTLELYEKSNLLEDSIYIFTAGIWNDATGSFVPGSAVTGAIYIEQGSEGKAQAFASELLALLDRNSRFNWSHKR